jgi:hypothetical protein
LRRGEKKGEREESPSEIDFSCEIHSNRFGRETQLKIILKADLKLSLANRNLGEQRSNLFYV